MALVESRSVGRVTELTHIVPFKRGGPQGLHGIRYADRCRIVLEAFSALEQEGFVSPVRRFSGIHFARWTLIDADTRLLFTTNFDGTFEDYIGDFVREIPWSLGLVWSNCEGYPPDRGDEPGAADYALFSRYVRENQVPVGLFYAHYGHLSVRDIRFHQVFHETATSLLANGRSATYAEIQQRTMARLREIELGYEGLPARPFPYPDCTKPMSESTKEIFRTRVGRPIRELYGYDDARMQRVFAEFGLLPGGSSR